MEAGYYSHREYKSISCAGDKYFTCDIVFFYKGNFSSLLVDSSEELPGRYIDLKMTQLKSKTLDGGIYIYSPVSPTVSVKLIKYDNEERKTEKEREGKKEQNMRYDFFLCCCCANIIALL